MVRRKGGVPARRPAPRLSLVPAGPTVLVAVPGLAGGVDEAARHLFGSPEMGQRWQVTMVVTKGSRGLTAPLVFGAALARLVIRSIEGRVDVLHLNVSSRGSTLRKLIVAAVARLVGVPYVIQLHGGGFDGFYQDLPGPAKIAVRWFFRGAGQVFVLGEPFRRLVCDDVGIDESRVAILRNAVTVPEHAGVLAAGDEPPMVLFTGRIGPGKGVPELLDALSRLADTPWRAVIAGDGDTAGTRARAAELGLADRIEVRGWQSRAQVVELLAAASIFVLPSHLEALSVSLLEAMAEGLCCVATPVGAHAEIVDHGDNGLLVTPGDVDELTDALRQALTDADLRARLGAAARTRIAETCSTEVVADQLSATYERILSDG